MTTIETLMLCVCFGAVMGTFIANLIFVIKDIIHLRKRKKQANQKDEIK